MLLTINKKEIKTNVKVAPAFGVLIGMDSYDYPQKVKRSYIIALLCFIIEVEVTKYKTV